MTGEVATSVDLSLLALVEQAVGADLLAYLLGIEADALVPVLAGEVPLDAKQVDVVDTLAEIKAAMPAELDSASEIEVIRAWVTRFGQADGASVARMLHVHVVGKDETIPPGFNDLEAALAHLALDSHPAFLMSPDPLPVPTFLVAMPSIRVMSLLYGHPQSAVFAEAVRKDAVLKRAFEQPAELAGGDGAAEHSAGDVRSFQSGMFARMVLSSAWRHIEDGSRSPAAFMTQAVRELHFVRDAIAGKSQFVTAKLGLMGVLLPSPTTRLMLSEGVVRAATDADHRLTPESFKGQLQTTDSFGGSVVVNYDGDLVFECQVSYKIKVADQSTDGSSWLSADIRPAVDLDEVMLRLRFSLMLAMERDHRVQIVPTWRCMDEPIAMGLPLSWPDARQNVGIVPVRLTEAEVAAWGEWYARLGTPHVARIGLALSRILRALAERREPSDVLIDSVIAWENLFGTKEGEPTFRVSTCLAVLLEDSFQARVDLKKKLSAIYGLRSKVVHGSGTLKQSEYPQCQEALEVAIRAVRVLTNTRTDILALPDGAARSTALLLGVNQKEEPDDQPA